MAREIGITTYKLSLRNKNNLNRNQPQEVQNEKILAIFFDCYAFKLCKNKLSLSRSCLCLKTNFLTDSEFIKNMGFKYALPLKK